MYPSDKLRNGASGRSPGHIDRCVRLFGATPMIPFARMTGGAASLPKPNIDTDVIMPKQLFMPIDRGGPATSRGYAVWGLRQMRHPIIYCAGYLWDILWRLLRSGACHMQSTLNQSAAIADFEARQVAYRPGLWARR